MGNILLVLKKSWQHYFVAEYLLRKILPLIILSSIRK